MITIYGVTLETYDEYKTYVCEMWDSGEGNELWETNLIVEALDHEFVGADVYYRFLTKEEFDNFDMRDYTEG